MAKHTFTANATWASAVEARGTNGYNTLFYSGALGGGTLSVASVIDGLTVPVADAKLSALTKDDNGDVVQQLTFQTSGRISVTLAGATAPNVTVVLA